MGPVVGRSSELGRIKEFLRVAAARPRALVVTGDPGIGKTAVWAESVRRARTGTQTTLVAQATEAERTVAFSALADLLLDLSDHALETLPPSQANALRIALRREEPAHGPLDPRVVGSATLGALRALTRVGSVLVAIDDVDLVDSSSQSALAFALRRGHEPGVSLLVSVRSTELAAASWLLGPRSGLEAQYLSLGPLDATSLREVVRDHGVGDVPATEWRGLLSEAAGNPLFAIELARSTRSRLAGQPLPEGLVAVVERRLAGLNDETKSLLRLAAAMANPRTGQVARAAGLPLQAVRDQLHRGELAGVVQLEAGRIRFEHPIYRTVLYGSLTPAESADIHRRLASGESDLEERARHLAAATAAPNARLAGMLDRATAHARGRGAVDAAAAFANQALELTPPTNRRHLTRRTLLVAELAFHAGDLARAEGLLRPLAGSNSGARADALRLLGQIEYTRTGFGEAIDMFEEAIRSTSDPIVLASLERSLAYALMNSGQLDRVLEHAARSLQHAKTTQDQAALAESLGAAAIAEVLLGRGLDQAKIDRALELEDPNAHLAVETRPSLIAGDIALYVGDLDRAIALLGRLKRDLLERGFESDAVMATSHLIWTECWRGELRAAERDAREAMEIAARLESPALQCAATTMAALSAAWLGKVRSVRTRVRTVRRLIEGGALPVSAIWANWATAIVALSIGEPRDAVLALEPMVGPIALGASLEPARAPFLPELIEALVGVGRLEDARRLLDVFEEAAVRLDRGWARASSLRCRALLHSASGETRAALEVAREAVELSGKEQLRLDHARSMLLLGELERRAGHRSEANRWLSAADLAFTQAGAKLWARRARDATVRLGGRGRAGQGLTPTELRAARLAARGYTNNEVARTMLISPKTVEVHLARVYGKLAIRTRAELGAILGDRPAVAIEEVDGEAKGATGP
jgi:DNA-binding CsgD family transcriptional regulator